VSLKSHRGFAVLSIMALAVMAVLISLGIWQVNRLAWKEQLIHSVNERIRAQPIPFAEWLAAKAGEDYWPVTITGTYRHEGERHFFATHKGQSGFYIYTPLQISAGAIVFVNRGFVPFDRKDQATRTEGQITGIVTVKGLARTAPAAKPSSIVPDNEPEKNLFYWKDQGAMAATAGLPVDAEVLPGFVDAAVSATPPSGLPAGGVTLVELPNNHFQYAITWFGLAATLAVIWSILAFRQFRRKA
jgi:surfeit locus 1 family protein